MTPRVDDLSKFGKLKRLVERSKDRGRFLSVCGSVTRVNASYVTVAGLSKFVSTGHFVRIDCGERQILAEVAAIERDTINVMPVDGGASIRLGAAVNTTFGALNLFPDISWCGRVLNPLGEPVDQLGPLKLGANAVPIHRQPPPAMGRQRLGKALKTGIKCVDFFTPVCAGQRIGIFAGSGVGKSTLLAMLGRGFDFDRIVLSLVGERGREVREFLDEVFKDDRSRTIAVVATSDESPMLRRMAPSAAMSIAEYYRDRGEQVLLIIDSVTRFAHAIRELALAFAEPPVARGYPPSVFRALPQLLERAGPGGSGQGTITAFVSVLVDGDDHNEPIADAVRGILDGHIVLDRDIAAEGRFPAVNPLRSISRLAPRLRTSQQAQFATQILELVSRFENTKDLRTIGGYLPGQDTTLDRAVELVPRLYNALMQDLNTPRVDDVYAHLAQSLQNQRRG